MCRSKMQGLQPELILHILSFLTPSNIPSHISTSTLLALTKTCRTWHTPSTMLLYSQPSPRSYSSLRKLHRTLTVTNPALGECVRGVEMPVFETWFTGNRGSGWRVRSIVELEEDGKEGERVEMSRDDYRAMLKLWDEIVSLPACVKIRSGTMPVSQVGDSPSRFAIGGVERMEELVLTPLVFPFTTTSKPDASTFPQTLPHLHTLTLLSLSLFHPLSLPHTPALQTLCLDGVCAPYPTLCEFLRPLTNLKTLSLRRCMVYHSEWSRDDDASEITEKSVGDISFPSSVTTLQICAATPHRSCLPSSPAPLTGIKRLTLYASHQSTFTELTGGVFPNLEELEVVYHVPFATNGTCPGRRHVARVAEVLGSVLEKGRLRKLGVRWMMGGGQEEKEDAYGISLSLARRCRRYGVMMAMSMECTGMQERRNDQNRDSQRWRRKGHGRVVKKFADRVLTRIGI